MFLSAGSATARSYPATRPVGRTPRAEASAAGPRVSLARTNNELVGRALRSDLAAQDAFEVGHREHVAVDPPRGPPGPDEVGEGHGRGWPSFAVHLYEHQLVSREGDRHDGVAVVVVQRGRVGGGDVVGQNLDLLAERTARGLDAEGGAT